MNLFTPFWFTLFTALAISLPILGGAFGGAAYYVDKNLPIKYKRASEINSQLDNYISPTESNALWRASEYFKAFPLDHLTDEHQKRISEILLSNLDNNGRRYISLMELAYQIPSPENDALFKAVVENNQSDPSFVQSYALEYLLKREKMELNPLLSSLIHNPKYTSPKTPNLKLIAFLSTSVHLSNTSDRAAVTLANNEEIIDELINIQEDWFEKYEEWRNINLNNGDHAFDIDEIIQDTFLAKKIEEVRNQMKAPEKHKKQES